MNENLECGFLEQISNVKINRLGFLLKATNATNVAAGLFEAATERLHGAVDARRNGAHEQSRSDVKAATNEPPRYLLLRATYLGDVYYHAGEVVEHAGEPHAYMEALNKAAETQLAAWYERLRGSGRK